MAEPAGTRGDRSYTARVFHMRSIYQPAHRHRLRRKRRASPGVSPRTLPARPMRCGPGTLRSSIVIRNQATPAGAGSAGRPRSDSGRLLVRVHCLLDLGASDDVSAQARQAGPGDLNPQRQVVYVLGRREAGHDAISRSTCWSRCWATARAGAVPAQPPEPISCHAAARTAIFTVRGGHES